MAENQNTPQNVDAKKERRDKFIGKVYDSLAGNKQYEMLTGKGKEYFTRQMSSQKNRNWLYKSLAKGGNTMPDANKWEEVLGYVTDDEREAYKKPWVDPADAQPEAAAAEVEQTSTAAAMPTANAEGTGAVSAVAASMPVGNAEGVSENGNISMGQTMLDNKDYKETRKPLEGMDAGVSEAMANANDGQGGGYAQQFMTEKGQEPYNVAFGGEMPEAGKYAQEYMSGAKRVANDPNKGKSKYDAIYDNDESTKMLRDAANTAKERLTILDDEAKKLSGDIVAIDEELEPRDKEYNDLKARFETKYPEGWQPRTPSELDAYNAELKTIKALEEGINAQVTNRNEIVNRLVEIEEQWKKEIESDPMNSKKFKDLFKAAREKRTERETKMHEEITRANKTAHSGTVGAGFSSTSMNEAIREKYSKLSKEEEDLLAFVKKTYGIDNYEEAMATIERYNANETARNVTPLLDEMRTKVDGKRKAMNDDKNATASLIEHGAMSQYAQGQMVQAGMFLTEEQKEREKQMLILATTQSCLDDTKERMNNYQDVVRQRDKDGNLGFWNQIRNTGVGTMQSTFDLDTWDFGLADVTKYGLLYQASQKAANGEELSEIEEDMLDAYSMKMMMEASLQLGTGFTAGQVTGESLPFMMQMFLSPYSKVVGSLANNLIKRAAIKAVKSGVNKYVAKYGLTTIGHLFADNLAAAGMSSFDPLGAGNTVARGLERATKLEGQVGKDGKWHFTDVEMQDLNSAMWGAFLDMVAENASEFAGASFFDKAFDALGRTFGRGFGQIISKEARAAFTATNVGQWLSAIPKNEYWRTIKGLRQQFQVSGLVSETMEELYGDLQRSVFGVLEEGKTVFSYTDEQGVYHPGVLSLDNFNDTAITLMPTQVMFAMLGVGKFGYHRAQSHRELNQAQAYMQSAFGANSDMLNEKLQQIEGFSEEEFGTKLREMLNSDDLNADQKAAIARYGFAYQVKRGVENAGKLIDAKDANQRIGMRHFTRGYILGANDTEAAEDEMYIAQHDRDELQRVYNEMGDEDKSKFGRAASLVAAGRYMDAMSQMFDDGATAEQRQAMEMYIESYETQQGIRESVNAERQQSVSIAQAYAESIINTDTGTIIPVTLNDGRTGYMTSGDGATFGYVQLNDGSPVQQFMYDDMTIGEEQSIQDFIAPMAQSINDRYAAVLDEAMGRVPEMSLGMVIPTVEGSAESNWVVTGFDGEKFTVVSPSGETREVDKTFAQQQHDAVVNARIADKIRERKERNGVQPTQPVDNQQQGAQPTQPANAGSTGAEGAQQQGGSAAPGAQQTEQPVDNGGIGTQPASGGAASGAASGSGAAASGVPQRSKEMQALLDGKSVEVDLGNGKRQWLKMENTQLDENGNYTASIYDGDPDGQNADDATWEGNLNLSEAQFEKLLHPEASEDEINAAEEQAYQRILNTFNNKSLADLQNALAVEQDTLQQIQMISGSAIDQAEHQGIIRALEEVIPIKQKEADDAAKAEEERLKQEEEARKAQEEAIKQAEEEAYKNALKNFADSTLEQIDTALANNEQREANEQNPIMKANWAGIVRALKELKVQKQQEKAEEEAEAQRQAEEAEKKRQEEVRKLEDRTRNIVGVIQELVGNGKLKIAKTTLTNFEGIINQAKRDGILKEGDSIVIDAYLESVKEDLNETLDNATETDANAQMDAELDEAITADSDKKLKGLLHDLTRVEDLMYWKRVNDARKKLDQIKEEFQKLESEGRLSEEDSRNASAAIEEWETKVKAKEGERQQRSQQEEQHKKQEEKKTEEPSEEPVDDNSQYDKDKSRVNKMSNQQIWEEVERMGIFSSDHPANAREAALWAMARGAKLTKKALYGELPQLFETRDKKDWETDANGQVTDLGKVRIGNKYKFWQDENGYETYDAWVHAIYELYDGRFSTDDIKNELMDLELNSREALLQLWEMSYQHEQEYDREEATDVLVHDDLDREFGENVSQEDVDAAHGEEADAEAQTEADAVDADNLETNEERAQREAEAQESKEAPAQQPNTAALEKEIADIKKKYADKKKDLQRRREQAVKEKRAALRKIQGRSEVANSLFGDLREKEEDDIFGTEEVQEEYSSNTVRNALRPYDERIADIDKQLGELDTLMNREIEEAKKQTRLEIPSENAMPASQIDTESSENELNNVKNINEDTEVEEKSLSLRKKFGTDNKVNRPLVRKAFLGKVEFERTKAQIDLFLTNEGINDESSQRFIQRENQKIQSATDEELAKLEKNLRDYLAEDEETINSGTKSKRDIWKTRKNRAFHRSLILLCVREREDRALRRDLLKSQFGIDKEELTSDNITDLFSVLVNDAESIELYEHVESLLQKLADKLKYYNKFADDNLGQSFTDGKILYDLELLTRSSYTGKLAETLLHEKIHQLTSYIDRLMRGDVYRKFANLNNGIQTVENYSKLITPEQREAWEEIRNIYNDCLDNKELFKGEFEVLAPDGTVVSSGRSYAMKNIAEFIAEMANPKHREDLKKLGLVEKIVNWFVRLLTGKDTRNVSAYERMSKAFNKMIDSFDEKTWEEYTKLHGRKYSAQSEANSNSTVDSVPEFSVRTQPAPKKSQKVYKLMRLGEDGKLYPLFIDASEGIELGNWYDADSPNMDMLREMPSGIWIVNPETGEKVSYDDFFEQHKEMFAKGKKTKYPSKEAVNYATANGMRWVSITDEARGQKRYGGENRKYMNLGINGSGAVSEFAMRPGWHAGSLPAMRQIGKGKNKDLRDDTFVWVEGSVSADQDYQEEANQNPDKDIPTHIPENGYYMKATNADKSKSQADRIGWYVAGSFKPERIMSDKEARDVIDAWNNEHPDQKVDYDYERESGREFDGKKLVEKSAEGTETGKAKSVSDVSKEVEEFLKPDRLSMTEKRARDAHDAAKAEIEGMDVANMDDIDRSMAAIEKGLSGAFSTYYDGMNFAEHPDVPEAVRDAFSDAEYKHQDIPDVIKRQMADAKEEMESYSEDEIETDEDAKRYYNEAKDKVKELEDALDWYKNHKSELTLAPEEFFDNDGKYVGTQNVKAAERGRFRRTSPNGRMVDAMSTEEVQGKVGEVAQRLGVEVGKDVVILDNLDDVPYQHVRKMFEDNMACGFYSLQDGKLYIYAPNAQSAEDIERTMLHESVGHKGLRAWIGDKVFDRAMRAAFAMLPGDVQAEIIGRAKALAAEYGRGNSQSYISEAMEEHFAEEAESGDMMMQPWYKKLYSAIRDAIRALGFKLTLTPDDVQYMLWKGSQMLKRADEPAWRTAMRDMAMRRKFGVGMFENEGNPSAQLTDTNRLGKQNVTAGSNGEYRLRRAAVTPSVAQVEYHKMLQGAWAKFDEAWHDNMRSLDRLERAIIKETGGKLLDNQDIYQHMINLSSVNSSEWQEVDRKFVQPMVKVMNDIMNQMEVVDDEVYDLMDKKDADALKNLRGNNVSVQDSNYIRLEKRFEEAKTQLKKKILEKYLYALHGEERNDVFAMRDAKRKAGATYDATINQLKNDYEDAKAKRVATGATTPSADEQAAEAALQAMEQQRQDAIDQYYAENRLNDYSGITDLFYEDTDAPDTPLSEYEDRARQYVADLESSVGAAELKKLQDAVKALTENTLKKMYDSGIFNKKMYNHIKGMFEHYVPLQGWDEETADDMYAYADEVNTGNRAATQKRANGRTSQAGDLIDTMIAQASSAIMQGNKNLAKQKLLNLAMDHKTALLTVDRTWYLRQGDMLLPVALPSKAELSDPVFGALWSGKSYADKEYMNMTPEEQRDFEEDFEDFMRDKQNKGEATQRRDRDVVLPVPATQRQKEQHIVRVKKNGVDYIVKINGDPNAAMAVNGALNKTLNSKAFDMSGAMNRFMARNFTSKSPSFLFRNMQRDIHSAIVNSGTKYGSDYATNLMKNLGLIMPVTGKMFNDERASLGVYSGIGELYRKLENDTLDDNVEIERLFKEFIKNGGETGYSQTWTIDEAKKHVEDIRKAFNRGTLSGWAATVGKNMELANKIFENTTRFAVYMTSRQMNKSILKSVADAKEASTNFNKHGSGAMFNAEFRQLVMFSNASIQGLFSKLDLAFNHNGVHASVNDKMVKPSLGKRAALAFGVEAMAGVIVTFTNFMLAAAAFGGGDDDDENKGILGKMKNAIGDGRYNEYMQLNDYNRWNRLQIFGGRGNGWITIELPPEEGAAFAIGAILAENAMGVGTGHMGSDLFEQVSRVTPLGGIDLHHLRTAQSLEDFAAELGKYVAPTVAKPFLDVITNKDYAGKDITYHTKFNEDDPEFRRLKMGTPEWQRALTEKLYYDTKGVVNINANQVDYVLRQTLGGLYSIALNVGNGIYAGYERYNYMVERDEAQEKAEKAGKVWIKPGTSDAERKAIKEQARKDGKQIAEFGEYESEMPLDQIVPVFWASGGKDYQEGANIRRYFNDKMRGLSNAYTTYKESNGKPTDNEDEQKRKGFKGSVESDPEYQAVKSWETKYKKTYKEWKDKGRMDRATQVQEQWLYENGYLE